MIDFLLTHWGETSAFLVAVIGLLKVIQQKKKKEIINLKVIDLANHDVFDTLNRVVYEVKVQRYYTHGKYDRVKTRMCLDFTKSKSYHCSKHMKSVLGIKNIDSMHPEELRVIITELQNEMHSDYIKAIKTLWLSKGIKEEEVDYVIFLFEKFRFDVVSSFSHRINAIFGSSFHTSNFEKILAVFDMWAMGIDLLPRDMHTTFENLNGIFKDIKY